MNQSVSRRGKLIRNAQGVWIRKCCASCANKRIQPGGSRFCKILNCHVKQRYCCREWRITLGLEQVGNGK